MKSASQIIAELKKIDFFSDQNITETHTAFLFVKRFYEQYPQYQELAASGVYFVRNIGKNESGIRVHEFENGSIWFVGDLGKDKNAPIASIGNWTCKKSWPEDLKNHSKIIETLHL